MRTNPPVLLWISVISLLIAVPCGAHTLDPHHPVWQRVDVDREALRRALADRAHDQVRPRAGFAPLLARAAAVGRRVLVVPVLPRDATQAPVDRATLEQRWFGDGETSVRGYWEWVSGGSLRLEGRVLPWLAVDGTVAQNYLNIRDGVPVSAIAAGPRNLARDALAAASAVVRDLSVFDDDGPDGIGGSGDDDGVLDLVIVLHPLPGWESGAPANGTGIVSLQARLRGEAIAGTGLRADAFVVSSATAPLGVWVHEFGHLLGLDDLYDFSLAVLPGTPGANAKLGGLGRWSLMASGTWGGEGNAPSALDAWSRWRLGFGEFTSVVGESFDGVLAPIGASAAPALLVQGLGDWESERFVLENRRRREGAVVDGDLPGSGVLVLRVDDRAGPIEGTSRWIEVLQADGRDDLAAPGGNDGDATDLFTGGAGADRLDATTVPSTRGSDPSPQRIPPVIEVAPALGNGAHPVRVRAADGPMVVLRRAIVRDAAIGDRLHMFRSERAAWELGFVDAGEIAATQVRVRAELRANGRPAELVASGPIDLVRAGGTWTTGASFEVQDLGALDDRRPIEIDLFVSVDSGSERGIELGLPVSFTAGLEAASFFDFVPRVLAATSDTTRFELLGITDLPRTTSIGWGLRTDGERRHANGVHVALEGPWFGIGPQRAGSMWSRHRTEVAQPGLFYDAGVIESWIPDRGWCVVEPRGPGVGHVLRNSGAPVRDRSGLGGDAPFWEPYTFELPAVEMPTRLRLRFGADAVQDPPSLIGWWEVAGLTTGRHLPSADLTVRLAPGGSLVVAAVLRGDLDRLDQVRFRYRQRREEDWQVASGLLGIRDEGVTNARIEVPETVRVFEVGLFAEIGGGGTGSTPPLLLGTAGFRRPEPVTLPQLVQNPLRDRLILQLPVRAEPFDLRVFDVRGREVARLVVPAGTDWYEWEPRGKGGSLLAPGRYFVALADDASASLSFTWWR
jgi:M6 family metalloprotease-like protein